MIALPQEILDLPASGGGAILRERVGPPRAWRGSEIEPGRCLVSLGSEALAELHRLAAEIETAGEPLLALKPGQFAMPALDAVMARAKALLVTPGVAVLDRLPLDDLEPEAAKPLFWVLGQCLGPAVAQKWDGTLLYDVTDTGRAFGYGVRGSWTSAELVFHTDNAFALAPPDHVGLLCLRPAREGGVSRFGSLYEVHNRLLSRAPDLLTRLYQPLLWDRQGEHAEGAPKVARGPMFQYDGQTLTCRANVSLVRKGYTLAGRESDAEASAALTLLEEIAAEPDLWFELPIERGQIQYLNNRDLAHYRSEFTDHPDPALKRHLIRSWHRSWGEPDYDG